MNCLCTFTAKNKKSRLFLAVSASIVAFVLAFITVCLMSYVNHRWIAITAGASVGSLVLLLPVITKRFEATKGCELSCLISKLRFTAGVGIGKKPSHVERIYLYMVYLGYVLINPIGNLLRLFLGTSEKEKRTFDNFTDDLVMTLSVGSIVIYFCSDGHQWWLASCFVWLILNISFHKLKEIADIARPSAMGDVASRRRTIILSLLNIVQLLFAYAFLYRYYDVIEGRAYLDGLLYAFRVFTTQGIDLDETKISYVWQGRLLISQFSVLVIVFIVFLGNMFDIQEEKRGS